MGINVGAFLGSTIVPIMAAKYGWRAGFAAPAVGMALGLAQFAMTRHYLGGAGVAPGASQADPSSNRRAWSGLIVLTGAIAAVCVAAILGMISIDPVELLNGSFWAMVVFAIGYFAYSAVLRRAEHGGTKRVLVMIALFVACAMFWAGFEQTGASLNLFADRYTDRTIFGWDMPAGVLQNVNPFFIIIFSPLFAALWVSLGRRNLDPSAPAKFALGLVLMGVGFVVMYFASQYVVHGQQVLPTWLILTYMFHTWGECASRP